MKNKNEKPVVIVGAGPSGLMQAYYLARVRGRKVMVVEQQNAVGGMFRSLQTPWGMVDQGVHILYESGYPDWDNLFFEILKSEDWHVYQGIYKDVAGNIFEGTLDTGSLYPDLRRLPRDVYLHCLADLFANIRPEPLSWKDSANLAVYFESRFGPCISNQVLAPIAAKFWKKPLQELSAWSAKIVHLPRVVTHDRETSLVLKQSPALNNVIGFPEQRKIPEPMLSSRTRALYPKRFGLIAFVEALCAELENHGVTIRTNTQINSLTRNGKRIDKINLKNTSSNEIEQIDIEAAIWTSPLNSLAQLLNHASSALPDLPVPHRVVHLFLDQRPETADLYWFWSYDTRDVIIRISNPVAYCPDAGASGKFPVCIEMHVPDPKMTDNDVLSLAESELRKRGVIAANTMVTGSSVMPGMRGFFVPSVANCRYLGEQRNRIEGENIENLVLSTQDISNGIFYLPDIINSSIPALNRM